MCWLSKWILLIRLIDCKSFMNQSLFFGLLPHVFTQYIIEIVLWMSHILLDLALLINKNKRHQTKSNCYGFRLLLVYTFSTNALVLLWSSLSLLNLLRFYFMCTDLCMVLVKVESFHEIKSDVRIVRKRRNLFHHSLKCTIFFASVDSTSTFTCYFNIWINHINFDHRPLFSMSIFI